MYVRNREVKINIFHSLSDVNDVNDVNSKKIRRPCPRTVSAPAVLMIAGTIPVDLLAAERTVVYKAKSVGRHITGHLRENTIAKWQRRWSDEDRGWWTAKLIPDIRP